MSYLRRLLSLVLFLWCVAGITRDSEAGAREHDEGLFLRLAVGGGLVETENQSDGQGVKYSGSGLEFDVAIGGIVGENVALHASVFGWVLGDADVEFSGSSSGSSSVTEHADMTAFGAGITYYFMPVNMYVSGSAGVGKLSGSGALADGTDLGVAGMITLGKAVWLSDQWSLGAAGRFGYHAFHDKSVGNWTGWDLGIMFSLMLN